MANYITASEYVDRFGLEETSNIATPQRSQPINTTLLQLTIDNGDRSGYTSEEIAIADETLAVINLAIDYATNEMTGYFNVQYNLPLTSYIITKNPIKGFCSDITRYRLAKLRPTEEIIKRYDNAITWLKQVASSEIRLLSDNEEETKKQSLSIKHRTSKYNFKNYY
jgi:phage gp36-like protein